MAMRVLVTSPGSMGHVHPMAPLARALAARGHDVLWAVPDRGVAEVERTGVRAVATSQVPGAGPGLVLERFPELRSLPPHEVPDIMFGKLFGVISAPPMLEGLLPVAREWRPDLVVVDAAEFAGPIVAAELGRPCVSKGFGPLLPERRVAAAAEAVAPLWRSRGLEPRAYGGMYDTLYLDPYPPLLQASPGGHIAHREFVRPDRDDGSVDPSAALPLPAGAPDAPLVYATMGTVFNDPAPLRMVADALQRLRVRALITVGPAGDPAALGPRPDHLRVERYVPQSAVLQHCDVVIGHGGSGTTLGAAALGLPQLILPQGADQFLNAAAIAASGAGLALAPDQANPESVAAAVQRLLDEPAFRDAAARVRESIAEMPPVEEVAALLETVAQATAP